MKKILAIFLTVALMFTLAACNQGDDPRNIDVGYPPVGGCGDEIDVTETNETSVILFGERYYYDAANLMFIMFNQDGTYIHGDEWGVIEGSYTIEDGLVWVAFGEDSEEPPEYFTIINRYTLENIHGSICTAIAGIYMHENGSFHLAIFDLDTERLNYRFIAASSQQETASGSASDNSLISEFGLHSIWVYSADGDTQGLEIVFYNDGHAVQVFADEGSEWDKMGITGYYEKLVAVG